MLGLILLQPAIAKPKTVVVGKHGTYISSIDVATKTVVLTLREVKQGTKQALVYHVMDGTAITVDGVPASLANVRAGMHVTSYTEADEHLLSALNVEN